jgi:hypothetical protein
VSFSIFILRLLYQYRLDNQLDAFEIGQEKLRTPQLAAFDGAIITPINLGLRGVHWTFAVILPKAQNHRVLYIDSMNGKIDAHGISVVKLVPWQLL